MKIDKIQWYIELYDTEKIIFSEIGPKAKKRGYLVFEEFFKICMWKSNRQKQNYLKNKQDVEQITKDSFLEKDEEKRVKLLCSLKGVKIPTASAILTAIFPEKYAVIDIRCINILTDFGYEFGSTINLNAWLKYTQIMREIANENNITPRQLDMAFFAMHKEKLNLKDFRNLYPSVTGKIKKI